MGHISRYFVPGSVRIGVSSSTQGLSVTAARTPDNVTVLVVMNESGKKVEFKIQDGEYALATSIPAHAIQTFSYQI